MSVMTPLSARHGLSAWQLEAPRYVAPDPHDDKWRTLDRSGPGIKFGDGPLGVALKATQPRTAVMALDITMANRGRAKHSRKECLSVLGWKGLSSMDTSEWYWLEADKEKAEPLWTTLVEIIDKFSTYDLDSKRGVDAVVEDLKRKLSAVIRKPPP